jgi:hypothetical protein
MVKSIALAVRLPAAVDPDVLVVVVPVEPRRIDRRDAETEDGSSGEGSDDAADPVWTQGATGRILQSGQRTRSAWRRVMEDKPP